MKGQGTVMVAAIIALVSGVIGFAILDSLIVDTVNLSGTTNESQTVSSVPTVITVSNIPIASTADGGVTPVLQNQYGNFTLVENTNYVILSRALGQINITEYNVTNNGTSVLVTYDYRPATFLDSNLSRTIMAFIVPLGLLGLLGLAAFVVRP